MFCRLWSEPTTFAFERAKEIKFLQDNRDRVRKVFYDYVLNSSETSDDFTFEGVTVEVTYSSETCDEDEDVIWDVEEGRITNIEISTDSELKVEDIGIDLAKLDKEQMIYGVDYRFVYHSKRNGIAIRVSGDEVDRIILFPSVTTKTKTCKNERASEFVSEKSWFGKLKLKDRREIHCYTADVADVTLSKEEFSVIDVKKEISVSVIANNAANDVLTYGYTVSYGKIVGKGDKVVWNLSGAAIGIYKITAAVDDGCGYCGKTVTKTVVIK